MQYLRLCMDSEKRVFNQFLLHERLPLALSFKCQVHTNPSSLLTMPFARMKAYFLEKKNITKFSTFRNSKIFCNSAKPLYKWKKDY